MHFTIREATLEDYEGLSEVYSEGDAFHSDALPHLFRRTERPSRSAEYIAAVIASEESALFVAESEGRIVGVIHAEVRQAPDFPLLVPRRYVHVDDLAVSESSRRQGVGQALMERTQEWAAGKGLTEIELHVWEFNSGAIAFYEQLGYQTTGRRMWRAL
jgi:diamine N-acetyltransferase